MKLTIHILAPILAATLFLGLAFSVPMSASAHDGEVQLDPDATQKEKMMALIELLEQLVVLLTQKAAMESGDHGDAMTHDEHAELAVWVELHSNQTHVHVKEPGKAEDSFLLEDIHYTDEDAVITATAMKTGLSEHDIEEVIVFPSGEVNEHGDSVHEDEHGDHDDDLAGIHIMGDGTVMLGNGEEVHDATVTADGMIMLSDGTIVEPKFDLR